MISYEGFRYGKVGDFFSSQDIYMYMSGQEVQFRTFSGDSAWQGEIKGTSAAGGKIGGGLEIDRAGGKRGEQRVLEVRHPVHEDLLARRKRELRGGRRWRQAREILVVGGAVALPWAEFAGRHRLLAFAERKPRRIVVRCFWRESRGADAEKLHAVVSKHRARRRVHTAQVELHTETRRV